MLSMVLAQHMGFILTWTQCQQSLPPVDLLWNVTQSPGTVSITSWNGKGCYTHKPACAAAEGMWWAAVSDSTQSSGLWNSTPARPHGTHRWAHSAALRCLCCEEKGSVYFESQMSSLLRSRTVYISRWTVRVWHLLETEPSVKCNLQLIGIALHYGKNLPTLPIYTIEMQVVVRQIWQPLLWHMLCITLLIITVDWVQVYWYCVKPL